MEPAGFGCLGVGFVFFLALLAGSAVLRAAVAVANRLVGPPKDRTPEPLYDWDWDGEEEAKPRRAGRKVIPEPGFGKGMMIASTIGMATVFVALVLAVFAEVVAEDLFEGAGAARVVVLAVLALPFAFVGASLLLAAMLPTAFRRAALVAFLYHLFGGGLVLVVAGVLAGAWHAVGP